MVWWGERPREPEQILNFASPARGDVQVRFALPAAGRVNAEVFDVAGRRVCALSDGRVLPAGEQSLRWNGRDDRGDESRGGVYLVRVRANSGEGIARIVLLR